MHTRIIDKPHAWPDDVRWPDGQIFKAAFLAECVVDGCDEASERQPGFYDTEGVLWTGSPTPLREGYCVVHTQ